MNVAMYNANKYGGLKHYFAANGGVAVYINED
jgi:hypothetical protein